MVNFQNTDLILYTHSKPHPTSFKILQNLLLLGSSPNSQTFEHCLNETARHRSLLLAHNYSSVLLSLQPHQVPCSFWIFKYATVSTGTNHIYLNSSIHQSVQYRKTRVFFHSLLNYIPCIRKWYSKKYLVTITFIIRKCNKDTYGEDWSVQGLISKKKKKYQRP